MANFFLVRASALGGLGLLLGAAVLSGSAILGCSETKAVGQAAAEALETDITGQVKDDRGEPVAGMTVRLYGLLDNTNFVEGSDINSASAYIDREAVLASNNTLATTETGADGRFRLSEIPNAFLAVAVKEDCSPAFAGFDETTGVLNVNTLITPNFSGGLNFEIPTFNVTCATPPDVTEQGNAEDAPPFEPPVGVVSCDGASCQAAGGTCSAETCVIPACTSDADCQAGQPGAFCENPGDVALAACHAPLPGEVCPPIAVQGWSGFRVTDTTGALLVDASGEGKQVAAVPADGIVRVYGDYVGAATRVYIQVQSGGASCANSPPRTDFIAASIVGGALLTDKGDFVELALHGGFQRIQLSTSETLGVGERSFVVEFGAPCAPPAHAFTAILTWDAGVDNSVDLDLNVWNATRKGVCVGHRQEAWGRLKHSKGPGPEVFESDDVAQGPFTIKVQSFCGPQGPVQGKLRIIRTLAGQLVDESYVFSVERPGDVAEIGVFAAE